MDKFIIFFIFLLFFTILDLIWIGFVVNGYQDQLHNLVKLSPEGKIEVYYPAALAAYFLLALAPCVFIFPHVTNSTSLFHFMIQGAALGLVIYGVYEMTNWSILKDWQASMVFTDIAWGTFLYAVSVTLTGWLGKHFSLFN